jgi:TolB-like protein/DNA-binding winged helix-turn-helix (wHTH) protein/Flp pilus assembly protein TadD
MSQMHKELYEFSRFRLDVSERLLLRDGKRVALTDKAFDTLCILIRRGGELVGKDELMSEVWADAIVEENNLDQKISMLRQALGERGKGKEKFIETVRGRGYRFLPEVRRVEEESPKSKVQSPKSEIQSHKFRLQNSEFEIQNPKSKIQNPNETRLSANVIRLAEWRHEADEETDAVESLEETGAEKIRGNAEMREDEIEPRAESKFFDFFKQNKRAASFIAASFVIIAVALFALSRFSKIQPQTSDAPIDSIAVLPFENAARDGDAEYLSDGITENLINRLSQLSNLKVMSSSSVFRYKGKERDAQKVGGELNVRAVLTGSVKQIGDRLIINVSLDDAKDNRRIWGEQYVRKFADILDVQNEIAQEVSSNLRLKLTGADERQLAKRYTDNVEAYQLYLKGMYLWKKHTQEDLQKGIEYFNQAIEKDPNYALAYCGLSASHGVLGNAYLPPNDNFPKAKAYAAKALAIDDTLAEAHAAMGAVRLFYEWDWVETEKEFKRAQALNPNHGDGHQLYAAYLEAAGRFDEARAAAKRASELDPLSAMFDMEVGITFYYARRYDEAIAQFEKTLNLEPRYVDAYQFLGQAYEQKKMFAQAIATYQKGIAQAERNPSLVALLGHAYALAGERNKARQTLDELREMSKHNYVSPYLFAVVYAGLGDKDQTFAWLDKAFQDRSYFLIWLKVEPQFDSLRDDSRFQDLLRRVGLPE